MDGTDGFEGMDLGGEVLVCQHPGHGVSHGTGEVQWWLGSSCGCEAGREASWFLCAEVMEAMAMSLYDLSLRTRMCVCGKTGRGSEMQRVVRLHAGLA